MLFRLLIAICFCTGSLAAQVASPAVYRTWTDLQQRKVEASFERVDGDNVQLKLRNAQQVTVPIASLSEGDRNWIAGQSPSAPDGGGVASDAPKAGEDWPRTVGLKNTPAVQTIREDKEKKEFVYESEHYQFICDSMLGANLVRGFSRVFEATWMVNCLLPLDFKPAPEDGRKKFQARIFTHASDYYGTGGPKGSSGVYISRAKALMLPLDSLGVKMFGTRVTVDYSAQDYATLVHEITHQMMNHWLGRLPVWYIEGSAVYVELAKYENGHFSFLQQDKRLRERLSWTTTGGKFQMVPLEKLMNIGGRAWEEALFNDREAASNYASAAALTYYFYHLDGDGKGTHFKEYIRAVEKMKSGEDESQLMKQYLLRDRDYAALQKDVQKSMHRIGIELEFPEAEK